IYVFASSEYFSSRLERRMQEDVAVLLEVLQRKGGQLSRDEARGLLLCSRSHFSRMFHLLTGRSFRDERLQIKLQRAANLLSTTSDPIADIAYAIGYQQRGKFDRAFKQVYGITPAEFRQNQHE